MSMTNSFKMILLLPFILSFPFAGKGQILERLGKKAERKINQRIDRKTDRVMDKGLDKVEQGLEGKATEPGSDGSVEKQQSEPVNPETNVSSKFDFIPGDKVLFLDDFSKDEKGDFPARWNTNGSGEVVTIHNLEGKWLKVPDNTLSFPELKGILPAHFTIEFDLYYPAGGSRPPITFGFTEVSNPAQFTIQHKKLFYFHIPPTLKDNIGYSTSLYSGREITQSWPARKMAGKPIHVSISVHKNRIRLYLDDLKLFDLPKAFEPDNLRNNFHFRSAPLLPKPKDGFYIRNIRIAETGLDARSQLLKNGKYSTTGIYFESGSAVIKQESFGVLKGIADIMIELPDLQINIIGHTDSDGGDEINQSLSLKRAEAVKTLLIQTFTIAGKRITVEGKGASQPVSSNQTEEGKAENRRVEFVKKGA